MTTAAGAHSGPNSNNFWVWAILGVGLLSCVLLAIGLPSLDKVTTGTHAVERHGQDAINARTALTACKAPRSKLCPGKKGTYGLTVVFWCETGSSLCPGMYTTIGGVEKTSFIRPCSQWRLCK